MRHAMRAQGDVLVITGPVPSNDALVFGVNQVRVPCHRERGYFSSAEYIAVPMMLCIWVVG